MFRVKVLIASVCAVITFAVAPTSYAAMPVIDAGAIAQLIMQIRTLQQQLTTARDQLTQARDEFRSITGGRGMEQLLGGTVRNYLPPDWSELERVLQGAASPYSALSANVQSAINANAVLTAQEVAALSAIERRELEAARRSAALLQVMTREALATTSGRFASIQQLINAIPAANDQKAILDLQARIGAEQSMLQNEQTKLELLYQAVKAEDSARRQRVREQAIADVGSLRRLPVLGL
jgi:type IV secretion system protein VirB5